MLVESLASHDNRPGSRPVAVVQSGELSDALDGLAGLAALALRAAAVALRVIDGRGLLVVRAVAPPGSPLAAELIGTAIEPTLLTDGAIPEPTRRAAERAAAAGVLFRAASGDRGLVGSVEVLRVDAPFGEYESAVADALALQLVHLIAGAAEPSVDEAGRHLRSSVPTDDASDDEALDGLAGELERARAVLRVVGEANATLSLRRRVETAVDRVADTIGSPHVGLYLREGDRVDLAAGTKLPRGHLQVARALFRASLGPVRPRPVVAVEAESADPLLREVQAALAASAAERVIGAPLRLRDEAIGLLAVYPQGDPLTASSEALLAGLAAQIALAVKNAQLHLRSELLAAERSTALAEAQRTERRLTALYEISNAFTESLSLERTISAIVATVVAALDVDAAVIRVPDERGELLVPRAVHVADERHRAVAETLLARVEPFRVRRGYRPEALDAATARRLGGAVELLVPFLEQGSTAALVPIAAKREVFAELTILSLDPARPIDEGTLATARTLALQAALALENAHLHQQLRDFAESMRRSLLPQETPELEGLQIGHRYESAAALEVGGDVFDFLELPDGRVAVAVGDVTGHGVDAAAEMAMTKFVFRSLARSHLSPSTLLADANDILEAELAVGGFITMACAFAEAGGGIRFANAGHPRPRLVAADGVVEELGAGGLALGIAPGEQYDETSLRLAPGSSFVLYTDGVVEARRDGELYGTDRLDGLLAASAAHSAQEMADAVLADCRAYAGGELTDDCAVVVIRCP